MVILGLSADTSMHVCHLMAKREDKNGKIKQNFWWVCLFSSHAGQILSNPGRSFVPNPSDQLVLTDKLHGVLFYASFMQTNFSRGTEGALRVKCGEKSAGSPACLRWQESVCLHVGL